MTLNHDDPRACDMCLVKIDNGQMRNRHPNRAKYLWPGDCITLQICKGCRREYVPAAEQLMTIPDPDQLVLLV